MTTPLLPRRQLLGAGLLAALGVACRAEERALPARPALRVGPGQPFARVAEALERAVDGDTIEVLPGIYRGDVAVIPHRRLNIIGLGRHDDERPLFVADGRHAEGKAIWVVRDGDIRIENIGFRGARVPNGNGAGIRFQKGRLNLHRCAFWDNQMGLLSGNDGDSELAISDSLFADAPLNPGSLPHLLYVGRIGRFSLRGSVLRHGREGHLLKSRAAESTLVGNRFDDGRSGEASYEVDLPNGGLALLEGNVLVQSPQTQNDVMASYGAEAAPWPDCRLILRRNTFVNHHGGGGWFLRVWADRLPAGAVVHSEHNRLLGPGQLLLGPWGTSVGDQFGPAPPTGS